jgi:hypothetical protein
MPFPKMPKDAQTRYVAAMILLGCALGAFAQTTQGLISGRITDSVTAAPIAANVTCNNPLTQSSFRTQTGLDGFYALPLLPPGDYDVEASAAGYQAKARFANALPVASSLSLDFALRPIKDVHEPILPRTLIAPGERSILDFYGPDVDPNFWTTYSPHPGQTGKLEPSISNAVRPAEIQQLPLEGNNIYSILLAEPGVAASNSTTRSLGIAANGMRSSSSSFLLDGVDTNFFLITGPLFPVSPESMQEYNFSTSNFSAEYGGAAGYIANAVTRGGGAEWHGQVYLTESRII